MPVIFHLNSGRVQVYRDGHDHYAPGKLWLPVVLPVSQPLCDPGCTNDDVVPNSLLLASFLQNREREAG